MNRSFYILLIIFMMNRAAFAQNGLPVVNLPENTSIHFISPEPIQYVDISTKNIIGDLPMRNILRIRVKDSCKAIDAVITITGERFIAQYHIVPGGLNIPTAINIEPVDTRPLDIAGIGLSQNQLKRMSLDLISKKPEKRMAHSEAFGVNATLNHVFTAGDYIFLDISYENHTHLKYDIDQLRFKIDDRKVTKASNVQSVEIEPEYRLFDYPFFKKHYRDIFVFRKMSFPGNRILHVELSEKQFSGRVISLGISWRDILEADIIPVN